MSWYELLLFLHVAAAIIWLGSGFLIQVLAIRAERAGDAEGLRRISDESAALGETLFIPASLAVLVLGVLLTIDGPWAFDQLWIVLGLAGYAATFVTGIAVMKPGTERIAAIMGREGLSPAAVFATRKLLIQGRADLVVLFLVIAVMTLKPTGDDVGVLVGMAAIALAGVGHVAVRVRALEAEFAHASPVA